MADLLTINAGDLLTIAEGDLLTIDGDVYNYGTLTGVTRLVCDHLYNYGTITDGTDSYLSGVEAHAISPLSILVSWSTDRSDDTYTIDRKLITASDWTTLSTTATGTSYTDAATLANVKYQYRVTNNALPTTSLTDPAWLTSISPETSVDPDGSSYSVQSLAVPVWTVQKLIIT